MAAIDQSLADELASLASVRRVMREDPRVVVSTRGVTRDSGDTVVRPLTENHGFVLAQATLDNIRRDDPAATHRTVAEDSRLVAYTRLVVARGDYGWLATIGDRTVGVAWAQFHPASSPGYGYVAAGTPELSVSVFPGWRGAGIGERLIRQVLASAADRGLSAVSLSVSPDNPARRLYSRLGFRRSADGVMMLAPQALSGT